MLCCATHSYKLGGVQAARCVAGTSLRTKLAEAMASRLTDIVCDAVLTVRKPDEPIDLYMVRPSSTSRVGCCSHTSSLLFSGTSCNTIPCP